jgi:resuscitation-promoting factor RpfB
MHVDIDGQQRTIYTSSNTLGEALESASILISPFDWISEDLMAPVSPGMQVSIHLAVPVTVLVGGVEVTGLTAADTVGEALQDLGIALQNLDYSLPAENDQLPETGEISVVRVSEQVLIMTDEVAYQMKL